MADFSYDVERGWDSKTYPVFRSGWDKKQVALFYTEKEAAAYVRWRNSYAGQDAHDEYQP